MCITLFKKREREPSIWATLVLLHLERKKERERVCVCVVEFPDIIHEQIDKWTNNLNPNKTA